ncbi:TIGR02099 family protein [Halomonas sp. EGI 63088]|uniref:TIGR02099 family protein n=1 Tax=Halomonas flagellata TaxID=2920385 RepID=A0ABS9RPL0_9GAMM|nr:YhdP family protein [Halomonas flagellata]MCH4561622.1 TIGR02099 family protein [Halomonas flagellata]
MPRIRLLSRWVLTLAALLLALVALLLVLLRLALGLAEGFTPRLEALLSSRFGAVVQIHELDTRLARLDPVLELSGLTVRSREGLGHTPLIEVEGGRLRLDTLASLREGVPVVEDARLQGVTLHLYQDQQRRWHWPDPARLPPELEPDVAFDLERLDFLVGLLLRQRAWVDDLRLVLHGQEQREVLYAPRLLLTGDDRHAHLEGEVRLEDQEQGREQLAMQAALELVPGPSGLRDFSAALQADMNLDSLVGLAEVLGRNDPLRLEAASGDARLWGRWHRGSLADARLDLDVPLLAMSHDDRNGELRTIVLEDVDARGQWLRRDDGWEAWLEGDAGSADWNAPEALAEAEGAALPAYWHLRRNDAGWWLNTSEFELGSLAAWRDRLPLPEALSRVVAALAPRGRVTGLGLGRENGHWLARAGLQDVAVSPWKQAPGGGPFDMWVEARDLSGQVSFVDSDGAELHFPEVFAAPMTLSHASGEVLWSYDGPRRFVSGRDLEVGWNGAEARGGFGLSVGGGQRGGFGLTLGFHDVDAIETPLLDWLPVEIMDEGLTEWLGAGVAGRVPEGLLRLHVPLAGGAARVAPSFGLELTIEQGRLPFGPAWPALEALEGRLTLQDTTLEATVARAESLGVEARDGRVSLVDEHLEVSGELEASAEALRRYLLAMPVEGIEAVEAWQGEGGAAGRLALALALGEPEALALDIDTDAAFDRLEYRPLALVFSDLDGPLAWRQRGEEGGLEGRLEGRLLGGPVRAEIDTLAGGLDLAGTAVAADLASWSGAAALDRLLEGQFAWQGRLAIGEQASTLSLSSSLEGLGIALPAPLGKGAAPRQPLRLDMDLTGGRLEGRLGEQLNLRWRELAGSEVGQGQVWLGRSPGATWPESEGWWVQAYQPRLDLAAWGEALAALDVGRGDGAGDGLVETLGGLELETSCLEHEGRCLGSFYLDGRPQRGGGWRLALDGSLVEGQLDYRPQLAEPLDVALRRLTLDGLIHEAGDSESRLGEAATLTELEPFPDWVEQLPAGRLRVADIEYRGRRFGPLTTRWRATPERLTIAPLGLTLGEVSARGELIWEAAGPANSLSRARLDLDGRDLGTALERLGQPVAIRNRETHVTSQLAWPGAPWQFALERSRGSIEVRLRDGRFVNIESPSARLVGLLNVDNLVRRLRLDFSDVTGQGTAFDSVTGAATLYGGILETRGPVEVEGPATFFTLEGSVNLVRRELDQRLGVTLPVSRNLPLAAVIAGAPLVGGALFIADRLFGDALDRVTRVHYRVRGPWTSPQISVESAE